MEQRESYQRIYQDITKEYTIPDAKKLSDRDTHVFKGWSRVDGGEAENETDTFKNVSTVDGDEISYYAVWDNTTDVTLHTKWKNKTYNIIFMQESEVLAQKVVEYGEKTTMPVQNICLPETVAVGVGKLSGWSMNGKKRRWCKTL